jgi:endonuclease YncB( thermonuclease family)
MGISSLSMARATAQSVSNPLLKKIFASFVSIPFFFVREFQSMSRKQRLIALSLLMVGFFLGRVKPFWTRYTSVTDIPSSSFGPNAPILTGRAVTVSDGDTIRFLHVPTRFHPTKLGKKEAASKIALPIRLCTIDTPETAKFGKPGQVRHVARV